MSELLAPAGTIEAFNTAISNGADAIYLGLNRFSARAYANNFDLDTLKPLLDFAHLREVKIYVTINTIIYDNELQDVFATIDKLASMGVDAIIIQDLAVANYIVNHYKSLHAHASTQMGVDDLDAAKLLKSMGFERIVFARETPISTIKHIKNALKIEVEAFVHGALCVSYSGNCYMSSAIGERSGNRGRCAGCCRKYYSLIDLDTEKALKNGYLLSMKDLNESSNIKDMSFVDSFKIEGRMKEPSYVGSVTNIYRHILDNEKIDTSLLEKVFNRTYTRGFMFGSTSEDITNIDRPNNFGFEIGSVIKQNKSTIWIRLTKTLNKGDQIRIETDNKRKEISVPIIKLFDANFNEVFSSNKIAVCSCREKVNVGAKVFKTKDIIFNQEIERSSNANSYKKIPIDFKFVARIGKPLFLQLTFKNIKIYEKTDYIVEEAKSSSVSKENIITQLSKLNDTPYKIRELTIELDEGCFIPLKNINDIRRSAIEKLNSIRLDYSLTVQDSPKEILPLKHSLSTPEITVEVTNQEQYDAAIEMGIKKIYFQNSVRRNNVTYPEIQGEVLVNGYGGINHYISSNDVVSDSSLNVTNHISAGILSSIGVKRITLSQEMSKGKIKDLIEQYLKRFNTYPNLELIVYGRSKIMHSKYCPLKRLGMCGMCKTNHFALRDDFADFPIIFNGDCTTTILNSKILNLMDDLDGLDAISGFRLVFTLETANQVKQTIGDFIEKLKGNPKKLFNPNTDTKGHFFKNPL